MVIQRQLGHANLGVTSIYAASQRGWRRADAWLFPDLTALLQALSEAGVEFVVVGVVAVAAHEYVRATEDVDLVPAPEHGNAELDVVQ